MFGHVMSAFTQQIQSNKRHLNALFYLRCVAIIGQSSAILWVHYGFKMPLPLLALFTVIALLVLSNGYIAYQLRCQFQPVITSETLAIQLTVDLMALALLCYFTGGVTNPFISLFLLPLAIAAAVLPMGYIIGLLMLTIFLYASLMVDYVALPKVPAYWNSYFLLHNVALWLNFAISGSLITGFIAYLAHQLSVTQTQLKQQQQSQAQQEQILALGTLAAGTAHELGTPLSTIAILAHDLQGQVSADLREDMDLLCQQVNQCKHILKTMVKKVESAQNQELSLVLAQQLKTNVLEKFQLLRPLIVVNISHNLLEDTYLASDETLEQAILNLLNNAADASPDEVEISIYTQEHKIILDIADRGVGLPPEMLNQLGQYSLSTKGEQGMGIGLLLANATLTRLGGEIRFIARCGGGVIARVILPIHSTESFISN
jgi:two-component system sensor histidine kinase RegB